jgi:hypothetical protein
LVNSKLKKLPNDIWIDNSKKNNPINTHFRPFNSAPIDLKNYSNVSYTNGCEIIEECGMGLTPMGYYPCALAGGIDRITGEKIGLSKIPEQEDDMGTILKKSCPLCGRFIDGHFIPMNLREKLNDEIISTTWKSLYHNWNTKKMEGKIE